MQGSAALDLTLFLLPPLALGLLATAHVAIVAQLFGLGPRWRAVVALLVPPFALVWGIEARLQSWWRLWLGALIAYGITVALAFLA